jgi:hypothetical protein
MDGETLGPWRGDRQDSTPPGYASTETVVRARLDSAGLESTFHGAVPVVDYGPEWPLLRDRQFRETRGSGHFQPAFPA